MFATPQAHLKAELARLDLLLHREVLRLRARYQLSLDEFRGLYVSDEQVDSLIRQAAGIEDGLPTAAELTARAEAQRVANAAQLGNGLPWTQLVDEFGLVPFEQDVLLLALAPEVDLKYETLYAYLNNDVSRKWPTRDLALRLFAADPDRATLLRRHLLPEAKLFAARLLEVLPPTAGHSSWLAQGFAVAPVVAHHLLGVPALDPRLAACVTPVESTSGWDAVPLATGLQTRLRRVARLFPTTDSGHSAPLLVFEGHYGAGRALAAAALCRNLGIPMLSLDLAAAGADAEHLEPVLRALRLQQRLSAAGIFVAGVESLFNTEGHPRAEAGHVLRQLARFPGPVILSCALGTRWPELLPGVRRLVFRFEDPGYAESRRLWEGYAAQGGRAVAAPVLDALATRFVLTPGQIRDAVLAAADARALEEAPPGALGQGNLFAAARAQSDQSLGKLAVKVDTIHTWDDLVLPAARLREVREIAAAIQQRHVVYAEWGFERRLASGKGLKVLFAGASGTGKTMTAGVIARDLGLDLYKIELSGVVSKYIGETEKNLDRVFRAAQASNAILFFDEADALFGKRSEVKDAHDRYANIEVSYLLQKLETHEGAVFLASNLSRNIDQAFSRRMHYMVEFPLPGEAHRERLWRGMFPPQTPLGEDVDFAFLARQFSIAGGDIQNVALDAAFLAAQDGRVVTMRELVRALARQMVKQGKVPSPSDFRQYHRLIAPGGQESLRR